MRSLSLPESIVHSQDMTEFYFARTGLNVTTTIEKTYAATIAVFSDLSLSPTAKQAAFTALEHGLPIHPRAISISDHADLLTLGAACAHIQDVASREWTAGHSAIDETTPLHADVLNDVFNTSFELGKMVTRLGTAAALFSEPHLQESFADLDGAIHDHLSRLSPSGSQEVHRAIAEKQLVDQSHLDDDDRRVTKELYAAICDMYPHATGDSAAIPEGFDDGAIGIVRDVLFSIANAPRVTVIGDAEAWNLEGIIHHGNKYPDALRLGGIISASTQMDALQLEHMRWMHRIHERAAEQILRPDGTIDVRYFDPYSPNGQLHYLHWLNDKSKLSRKLPAEERAAYRQYYCTGLRDRAEATQSDLYLLSNLKVFLSREFVEPFEGKVINLHPSVLPLYPGFMTEFKSAIQDGHAASIGYTMHVIDKFMDKGDTLAYQRVPFDKTKVRAMADKVGEEYETFAEETLRMRIIKVEAESVPKVLALYGSDRERMIVEDQDAWDAEARLDPQRADMASEPKYVELLQEEHAEWVKKDEANTLAFDEWRNSPHRKKYRRCLFKDDDGDWRTAEEMCDINPNAEIEEMYPLCEYSFTIPAKADPSPEHVLHSFVDQCIHQYRESTSNKRDDGSLECTIRCTNFLGEMLDAQGIEYEMQRFAVRHRAEKLQGEIVTDETRLAAANAFSVQDTLTRRSRDIVLPRDLGLQDLVRPQVLKRSLS